MPAMPTVPTSSTRASHPTVDAVTPEAMKKKYSGTAMTSVTSMKSRFEVAFAR